MFTTQRRLGSCRWGYQSQYLKRASRKPWKFGITKYTHLTIPNWQLESKLVIDPALGRTLDLVQTIAPIYTSHFSPSGPRVALCLFLHATYSDPTSLIPDIALLSSASVPTHSRSRPTTGLPGCFSGASRR